MRWERCWEEWRVSEGHHVLVVQAEIRKGQKPSVTVGSSLEVTRGGCGAARSRFIFNFSASSHRQTGLLVVEPGKRLQVTFRARC